MAWIWWLEGPSFSRTLTEEPTRMCSICLVGSGLVAAVPNNNLRWVVSGLAGGVGVKAGALVGWERRGCRLFWSGECKLS